MPALRHRVSSHVARWRKPDNTTLNRLPDQYVTKVIGTLQTIHSVEGISIASEISQPRQARQRRMYNLSGLKKNDVATSILIPARNVSSSTRRTSIVTLLSPLQSTTALDVKETDLRQTSLI